MHARSQGRRVPSKLPLSCKVLNTSSADDCRGQYGARETVGKKLKEDVAARPAVRSSIGDAVDSVTAVCEVLEAWWSVRSERACHIVYCCCRHISLAR